MQRQREDRMAKARRFDAMCRQLGYTRRQAAKTLQVSERTLHNWVSGTTAVPYAAYKLLRVLCFHEIPFKGWHGWHFSGGKLWSPEGHGFTGLDSSWWSLLVRQARSSGVLFEQQREFRATIERLRLELAGLRQTPTAAVCGGAAGTLDTRTPTERPAFTIEPFEPFDDSISVGARLGRFLPAERNSQASPMVITGITSGVTSSAVGVSS